MEDAKWIIIGTMVGILIAILIKEWVNLFIEFEKKRILNNRLCISNQILMVPMEDKIHYALPIPVNVYFKEPCKNILKKSDVIFSLKENYKNKDTNEMYRKVVKRLNVIKKNTKEHSKMKWKNRDFIESEKDRIESLNKRYLLYKLIFLSLSILLLTICLYKVLTEETKFSLAFIIGLSALPIFAFYLKIKWLVFYTQNELFNLDVKTLELRDELSGKSDLVEILWNDNRKSIIPILSIFKST